MSLSGYSFIHNGIEGGYPFVEAIKVVRPFVDEMVIVDMESTDGTREVLEQLDVTILDGKWGNEAGETLKQAHDQYIKCSGDVIIHFEADEVYDPKLLKEMVMLIGEGIENLLVYRLQVEQNFQRIRWYPEPVHRVFPKYSNTKKQGHTTNNHDIGLIIPAEYGFLWDVTNCFRDNYLQRIQNQAELWHDKFQYILSPLHVMHPAETDRENLIKRLEERHWTWKKTPLAIPKVLENLVGQTKYDPNLSMNSEV